jgi:hypothetical protein
MIEKIDTIYGTFDKKQLQELKGYIDETVQYMETIKVTNQSMNDIATIAYNSLKIPKKMIRKLAKAQFKQSLKDEVTEFKEFEALFETLSDIKQ